MTEYDQYTILNNISDSVLIIDQDYTVVFANDYLRNLIGVSAEKLVGEKCYSLLHHSLCPCAGKSVPQTECIHKQVFETGSPMCVKHHHIMPDGSKRFSQISASPIKDENGAVVRIICIAKDITKQEELRKALNKVFSEYKAISENVPCTLAYLDREMRIIKLNPRMEQLVGYKSDEVQGKHCYDVWGQYAHDATKSGKERICDDCKAQYTLIDGRRYTYERKVQDRYFEIRTSPVKDEEGQIIGLLECGLDITERKKAEYEIARAKKEWESTFDAMSDIVTIQDKDMRIIRANKRAHDFFQIDYGDLVGRYCYEIFRGITGPCRGCPALDTLSDMASHSEIIQHKNLGKIFEVSSSVVTDENGNFEHLVHTAKDITEQKRLEEEIFQSHKMEAIGTLAGGIAHDFNNILTAIVGYTELAKMRLEDGSPITAFLAEVLKASRRATNLVNQILTFSRKGEHKREKLQPYLIVKEALKLMRASLPSTLIIQEEINLESGAILADPTKIHQIIVNLCTNALHAMGEETGILKVRLARNRLSAEDVAAHPGVSPGPFIELAVSDSGCGMDQQTQQRIFEPYFTTKETGKGTGLGLALVSGIVHDYGGIITVESELEKGTTIHIYFPAITEEVEKPAEAEEELPLPTGTERILTVDDESLIVGLHNAVLTDLGYTVTMKTSSQEALAAFKNNPRDFDLLITDQTMPALTGAQLAQEALNIRPDIPIILCTGYSSTLSEKKALEIGIRKYLMKPVDSRVLASTVRSVLDEKV